MKHVCFFVFLLFLGGIIEGKKVCNVLDYGAIADNKTDVGPAIYRAYLECGKNSGGDGLVIIPEGNYLMNSSLQMGYRSYVVQLDGIISLAFNPTGLSGATLFSFNKCSNITLTGKGKILGYGDLWRPNGDLNKYGRPRFVRFEDCSYCKVTHLTFINAPSFHVIMTGSHHEVAYIRIEADDIGTTDGVDINGDWNYVHDIYVQNGDECVSIKSGTNFYGENIYCVYGGGGSVGSFGDYGTSNVQNAYFKNITSVRGGLAFIKAYSSTKGFIRNITYDGCNFEGVAYPISINTYWAGGDGSGTLAISDIYFKNFNGTLASVKRPAVRLHCLPEYGCYNINFENVNIIGVDGTTSDSFSNACGNGRPGLPDCKNATYTTAASTTTAAAASSAFSTLSSSTTNAEVASSSSIVTPHAIVLMLALVIYWF